MNTWRCDLCEDHVEIGTGPTDLRWRIHDHLTIDHAIPAEEAERLEPD